MIAKSPYLKYLGETLRIVHLPILFLSLFLVEVCQGEALTTESTLLRDSHQNLQLRPMNKDYQRAYLKYFPTNAKIFDRIFNPKNKLQLYDGIEYVFALENISQFYPQQVLSILFDLTSELKWSKGAADYLQLVMMKVALNNPLEFADQFQQLTANEQGATIAFLKSGVKGPATGYRQLANILTRIDRVTTANQLLQAQN